MTRAVRVARISWLGLALTLASCQNAASPSAQASGALRCLAGAQVECQCPGGSTRTQVCATDGSSFSACPCDGMPGASGSAAQAGVAGAAGTAAGAGGAAGGVAAVGGSGGNAGQAGAAGVTAADGGSGGNGGSAGAAGTSGGDSLEAVRQTCVDTINMYRAMKGLAPMMRATMSQETCSDMGAKKDGDSGQAHSSAGDCAGFGAQDACPGWGVGGFSGNATLADALKGCLKAMWDEGEPPVSRSACIQDYQNCFLKYGHYLNMTSDSSVVACGFYQMTNGKWWMNQDFAQ